MMKYYEQAGRKRVLNPNYPRKVVPTFYKALRDVGYWTMTSGKDDLTKEKADLDEMLKLSDENMQILGTWHIHHSPSPQTCATIKTTALCQLKTGFEDHERSMGKTNTVGTTPRDKYGLLLKSQQITAKGKKVDGFVALQLSYENGVEIKTREGPQGNNRTKARSYRSFLPDWLYEDNFVANVTTQMLRRRPRDKPFFLQVNFPGETSQASTISLLLHIPTYPTDLPLAAPRTATPTFPLSFHLLTSEVRTTRTPSPPAWRSLSLIALSETL